MANQRKTSGRRVASKQAAKSNTKSARSRTSLPAQRSAPARRTAGKRGAHDASRKNATAKPHATRGQTGRGSARVGKSARASVTHHGGSTKRTRPKRRRPAANATSLDRYADVLRSCSERARSAITETINDALPAVADQTRALANNTRDVLAALTERMFELSPLRRVRQRSRGLRKRLLVIARTPARLATGS